MFKFIIYIYADNASYDNKCIQAFTLIHMLINKYWMWGTVCCIFILQNFLAEWICECSILKIILFCYIIILNFKNLQTLICFKYANMQNHELSKDISWKILGTNITPYTV